MSSQIAGLESDRNDFQEQLDQVVDGLQNDPNNAELNSLKTELQTLIDELDGQIAELKQTSAPATASKSEERAPAKWSKEKHPAFQPGYRKPGVPASPAEETPTSVSFNVNDMVLARWVSGDKQFYAARITAITGSSADPIYNVLFKGYDNTDTVRTQDLKPVHNGESKKRKAEAAPAATPTTTAAPGSSNVISAAANINPDLASQAKREPSKVSDGPVRPPKLPRKLKQTRELEAGKNKWQEFSSKGKFNKASKKESMFRTGEGVNARGKLSAAPPFCGNLLTEYLVGFTGSGQAMRKDPTRSKYNFKQVDEDGT